MYWYLENDHLSSSVKKRHRQSDKQTDRETEIERDIETERDREKETEKQRETERNREIETNRETKTERDRDRDSLSDSIGYSSKYTFTTADELNNLTLTLYTCTGAL